ncbi:MAG: HAD family hydrolase [Pseudomonadales bacterium]|nr:HAD family hydrolase [Pseudomonadales bacterium]
MTSPISMLALDLDGTLALDDHQVSSETRAALADLANDGIEVVIATGRRYRTTRFVIENLGLDVYAVCNGGALGKTPGMTNFHHATFEARDLADIVGFARDHGLTLSGQRDSHTHGGADIIVAEVPHWHEQTRRYFDDNRQWSARGNLEEFADEILVMGVFNDEKVLGEFESSLHRTFPGKYNTVVVPHLLTEYFYCEITQKDIDKWHGLTKLGEMLEVDAQSVCAVGDQLNDLPMVCAAGHGFAMGNGNPELQKHADHICGNHDEDGLIEVVEYIRQHNSSV